MKQYHLYFNEREVQLLSIYYWIIYLSEIIICIPLIGPGLIIVSSIILYMGLSFAIAVAIFPNGDFIVLISGIIIMILLYKLPQIVENFYDKRCEIFERNFKNKYKKEIELYMFALVDLKETEIYDSVRMKKYITESMKKFSIKYCKRSKWILRRIHFNTYKNRKDIYNSNHLKLFIKNL